MRLSRFVMPAIAFVLAAIFCLLAARFAAALIEDASRDGVRQALDEASLPWADADTNGLQVFLIGTAPSEAERFRALTVAGTVVDSARVLDNMNVAEAEDLAPPRFSIEILRNDSVLSLIGLIPASMDRDDLLEQAREIAGETPVKDLLDAADYPEPEGWQSSVTYALRALEKLPRSKISAEAGRVKITADTDSEAARAKLLTDLNRRLPKGLEVDLDLSAPRPVITPFTLRFLIDPETGPRFDACSADTDAARETILAAARAAGAPESADCRIGLGVPSKKWARAAADSIGAVKALEGGSVTLTDADVSLIAPQGTSQASFDRIVGELDTALPDVFALTAVLPKPETDGDEGPAEFIATLSPEGDVQLRGRVSGELPRQTAESYAQAKFGAASVYMAARVDEDLPQGWPVRVLASLEALSLLSNGSIIASAETITVKGVTGRADASTKIAALLTSKLGDGADYSIDVSYKKSLDPIALLPTPQECQATIAGLIAERKINFEPGSEVIDANARQVIDEIAEVLKRCGDIKLEIAGYTDSQGREEMNLALSQKRAQSVIDALRMRRVLTGGLEAKGYGEADPIADNATEEGREANRRIEFRLIAESTPTGEDTESAETAPKTEDNGDSALESGQGSGD